MNWVSRLDEQASIWIKVHLHHPRLSWMLSRVNRGEVLALFLIPVLLLSERYKPLYVSLPIIMLFAFVTDRLVLVLKKYFSRKRPLISVMGKVDNNPDMKHSFPSAHSANSLVVVTLLVLGFGEMPYFFLFSLFAGVGRLLTLHHFISDILGGWIIGFIMGLLGLFTLKMVQLFIV